MGTGMSKIKRELMNGQRTIEHVALFPRSPRGAVARRSADDPSGGPPHEHVRALAPAPRP